MFKKSFHTVALLSTGLMAIVFTTAAARVRAQQPTTVPATAPATPAVISASDKAAIDANMNRDVIIEALCTEAAWSASGKVMNLKFADTTETRLSAVVFVKDRQRMDEAFGSDASKAWSGAKLRIKGKLREYAGKSKAMQGRPEVTIVEPSQVTVIELPPAP